MSKAADELEVKRWEIAFHEISKAWWWFEPKNEQHIHQFSAAWEILRRTEAFRLLHDKLRSLGKVDSHSSSGVLEAIRWKAQADAILQRFPPVPNELREMVGCWQNLIANGWTPKKTYLEASRNSRYTCELPDGKAIRIPPICGSLNQGVPIILPRQVLARGHIELWAELCDIISGQPARLVHVAGPCAPTTTLRSTGRVSRVLGAGVSGRFVAIEFDCQHPVEALRASVKLALTRLAKCEAWQSASGDDVNSSGPKLVVSTCQDSAPFRVVVFFSADESRNTVERGFRTLIRPKRMRIILKRIRKEWVKWNATELMRLQHGLSGDFARKISSATWKEAATDGKLARQSTVRPINPKADLKNLACADCAPYYKRNHSRLPTYLQDAAHLEKKDTANFNKRIETGERLVQSVDELFLPLLNYSPAA